MDYEGVDANSFTVNLKRKKFPWVLTICAGFFFAIVVPVIIIQGQPEPVPENSLISNLVEPAPEAEVITEEPIPVPEPVPVEPEPIVITPELPPEPFVEPELAPAEPPTPIPPVIDSLPAPVLPYENCDDVRRQNRAPILSNDPGYEIKLDRDGDGVGCES
jgi:hypothetical protein